jgi:hypothetical protein
MGLWEKINSPDFNLTGFREFTLMYWGIGQYIGAVVLGGECSE